MTPNEFKAWFDGFTEAFTGCPTKAQWTRIKARVAEIDGKPVTQTVYLDRYLPSYPAPIYPAWRYLSSGVSTSTYTRGVGAAQCSSNATLQNAGYATSNTSQIGTGGAAFNSLQAMADLGRADAQALTS